MGDFNSEVSEAAMKDFCDLYHLKSLIREPTCFKNPLKPSCIDLFSTNCSRSFQNSGVVETGLSDFHKMNLTVLKTYFCKRKHDLVFYRNYKNFNSVTFGTAVEGELLKSDINNIELDTFHNIFLSVLNEHAPLKQKHLRANHGSFVTKELRKAIMKRSRLRNVYLQYRTEISKIAYNKQRNICVSLLKKSKRSYFGNLDIQTMTDNKKFWKRISPLFSNKRSHLLRIVKSYLLIPKLPVYLMNFSLQLSKI